jgi:hypothetical protein
MRDVGGKWKEGVEWGKRTGRELLRSRCTEVSAVGMLQEPQNEIGDTETV